MEGIETSICRTCGRQFRSRSGLSSHERRHENKAPYKCCGKVFFSRADLTRHRCSCHGQEKAFKCKVCARAFALNADLHRHATQHHDATYTCDTCDFTTNYKHIFEDHVAAHDGARRHVCTCGQAYKYRSNLNRHKLKYKRVCTVY